MKYSKEKFDQKHIQMQYIITKHYPQIIKHSYQKKPIKNLIEIP